MEFRFSISISCCVAVFFHSVCFSLRALISNRMVSLRKNKHHKTIVLSCTEGEWKKYTGRANSNQGVLLLSSFFLGKKKIIIKKNLWDWASCNTHRSSLSNPSFAKLSLRRILVSFCTIEIFSFISMRAWLFAWVKLPYLFFFLFYYLLFFETKKKKKK